MTKRREQITTAAQAKIDEEILGAAFAKPRGATTLVASGGVIAREIGAQWTGKQHKRADAAGIKLGNPGAVVVTPTSLVTMQVGVSFTGQIKEIKEILSTVPLAEVDLVEVKRAGLAGVMEITSGGSTFKLEGNVPDMRELADAFNRAKASA